MASTRFAIADAPANRHRQGARSFIDHVLLSEFRQLSGALTAYLAEITENYLAEITEKLIREEIHGETADAEERDEPRRLAR